MKTTLLTILALTIVHLSVMGQSKKQENYSLTIDTLSIKSDSVLAKIFTYSNDILVEEIVAFLFPDSIRSSRFRIAPNIFKKTVYVDRFVRHGETVEYTADNMRRITEYYYGTATKTFYYDNDKEISKEQFNGDKLQIGPCGVVTGEYLIHGRKKK